MIKIGIKNLLLSTNDPRVNADKNKYDFELKVSKLMKYMILNIITIEKC